MTSDDENDLNSSYLSTTEDSDDDRNDANFRGPWFTVMEPHSFVVARLPTFIGDSGPVDFLPNMTPFEYFRKFTMTDNEDIFDLLVEETNRYASNSINGRMHTTLHAREKHWTPVSKRELMAFFGLVFAMGIVKKPSYASYWERNSGVTETPGFSEIMSRNRFQLLLRYLHCNDNDTAVERGQPEFDPLHKVKPVIDFFNRTFEENYRLSQNVCIDERMIGFKGRHFLKQYIANKKAHRWGVKAWVLAESQSGYTHQIEIYKGKQNTPRFAYGQGYQIVMDLMRPHFGDNHHVTIDNWFTSPKLMHDLRNRGTFATGTVMHSRKGMPNSFKHVRLPKGDTLVKTQGPLMAVLYSDRRQVTLLTTVGSAKMTRQANSKGKVVKAPQVVHKYNQTMGGVDLGDQLISQYDHQFRSVKLWKKILFNFFMTAAVNAYICYKTSFVIQKKMDHLKFQQEIVKGLLGEFREGHGQRGRRSLLRAVRTTARHFVEYIPEKRRLMCSVCKGKKSRFSGSRVRTWCPDCGVGLCVGQCFRKFHTTLMYEE